MFKIEFSSINNDKIAQLAAEKLNGTIEDWEAHIWKFISQICDPSIKFISIFTSGSTGAPKEIKHSKQAIFNSAEMTCEALNLKHGNQALLCLPANKIGGMMMIARSFFNKMDLYCIKPTSKPLSEITGDFKIDFAALTPMQFHEVSTGSEIFKKAAGISKIILGGQNIERELEQVIQKMSNEIYLTYAMTETISHIALKKLSGGSNEMYYTTLPGVKISVDDRGCMIIDAPKLECKHLVTNDIIKLVDNNKFEWIGRWDNVINSGGVKIYPEELEQKLTPFLNNVFFITSVPDNKLGQKLIIVIEAEKMSENEIKQLQDSLSHLSKIQQPKETWLAKTFIRTENGKVKRNETLKNAFLSAVIQSNG